MIHNETMAPNGAALLAGLILSPVLALAGIVAFAVLTVIGVALTGG